MELLFSPLQLPLPLLLRQLSLFMLALMWLWPLESIPSSPSLTSSSPKIISIREPLKELNSRKKLMPMRSIINPKYSLQVGLRRINKDSQPTFLECKLAQALQLMTHLKWDNTLKTIKKTILLAVWWIKMGNKSLSKQLRLFLKSLMTKINLSRWFLRGILTKMAFYQGRVNLVMQIFQFNLRQWSKKGKKDKNQPKGQFIINSILITLTKTKLSNKKDNHGLKLPNRKIKRRFLTVQIRR